MPDFSDRLIDLLWKLLGVDSLYHHCWKVGGVMLRGSGDHTGENKSAFHIHRGMLFHPKVGLIVLYSSVRFYVSSELGRLSRFIFLFPLALIP